MPPLSDLSLQRKRAPGEGRGAASGAVSTERRDSVATRTRITEAAQRLYAERGIDAVSLREIGEAAGQRNTGAIQYHFGDRAGLLRAVFALGSQDVNERRAVILERLHDDATLAELTTAIVRPFAASIADGSTYVPFLARLIADRRLHALVAEGYTSAGPSYQTLATKLGSKLGHLPAPLRGNRIVLASEMAIFALSARAGAARGEPLARLGWDRFTADLVEMLAGMLGAPAGE